jgi:hypothetical protein
MGVVGQFYLTLKKAKAVPLHVMMALGGRGIYLILILDLGRRWG